MILTCGPGTPAAIVNLSKGPESNQVVPAAATAQESLHDEAEDDNSSSSSSSASSSSSSSSGVAVERSASSHSASRAKQSREAATGTATAPSTSTPTASLEPVHSRSGSSGSSSATTGAKRTLSDRLKLPEDKEEGQQPKQHTPPLDQQHDMNLDTGSSTSSSCCSSDDDDGGTHEKKTGGGKEQPVTRREKWTKKKPEHLLGDDDDCDEMVGYSDIEAEMKEKEEKEKAFSGAQGNDNSDEDTSDDDSGAPKPPSRMETDASDDNGDNNTANEEEKHEEIDEEEALRRVRHHIRTEEVEASDDDDELHDFREMAAEWFALEQAQAEAGGESGESDELDDDDDDNEDDHDDEDDSDAEEREAIRLINRRRILRSRSPHAGNRDRNRRTMKPALRHGGCINTAAWLQTGWRLSTVSSEHYSTSFNANLNAEDPFNLHAVLSDDCPTQLVTSGDDRLVKFWDVRHAMGTANPLPWGRNTYCPFASTPEVQDNYRTKWQNFYQKQKPVEPWKIAGNVIPLASLNTGHRLNVFHVTPLWQQPGKVATCGADGYLRLGDVEASSSGDSGSASIIISPEYTNDGSSRVFLFRPGMCFSHHFLNSNVGLLCSESGLRKFDIRLPPRQQERTALLKGDDACKACAIWSVSSATSVEEVDSTYVFGEYRMKLYRPVLNVFVAHPQFVS